MKRAKNRANCKSPGLSFPRKREFIPFKGFRAPAFARVTPSTFPFSGAVSATASALVVLTILLAILFTLPSAIHEARAAESNQAAARTAGHVISLKTIIVGDYYPYTFVNSKGEPDGFSVDIARAAAGVMDRELAISVDTWANATKALAEGSIDMLPMMAASPERDKIYDFSSPHTIAYDAIFARKETKRAASLKELAGKNVIVMEKDVAHQYLMSSGMAVKMKLILVHSLPDALRTLAEGRGDAAVMPKLVGLVIMKKLNLANLDPDPVVIEAYNRPFSFAVKDGNQALLERLTQGLNIIKSTGEYQKIYDKWFGALEPRGIPWKTMIIYIGVMLVVFLVIALGLVLWNVALKKQVAFRTEHLAAEVQERKQAEEALRKTQEIITAKNKELENYLYIASHDLRSPLVNIQGFSRRLQKHADSIKAILADLPIASESKAGIEAITEEEIPKTLNFISSSAAKMDALLNGLLQLSRTGRALMVIGEIDMNQLFKAIIANYNYQLTELDAIVTLKNLPFCYGDADLLNQLFSNIIGNAIKYRDRNGQLTIEITGRSEFRKAVYSIRDNGIGIEARHLERIWDVFYRVDAGLPDAGEGLGLSIVRRIAEKHYGRVWMESEPGKGSVFHVELQTSEFSE